VSVERHASGSDNHHAYQPHSKLYTSTFQPALSFADYQRQIEIVSDPTVVERWKEEARKVTTYTTLREQTSLTFSSVRKRNDIFVRTISRHSSAGCRT